VQKRTRRRHGKSALTADNARRLRLLTPIRLAFSVKENPPASDLNKDECERVVINLIILGFFNIRIGYNAHCTLCYLELPAKGVILTTSPSPQFQMSFPKREPERRKSTTTGTGKVTTRKAVTGDDGWLTSHAPAKKKAKKSKNTSSVAKRQKPAPRKATTAKKRKHGSFVKASGAKSDANSRGSSVIIELSSSDDASAEESNASLYASGRATLPRAARQKRLAAKSQADPLWDESQDGSDDEYEFDG
jgi:hypothetical protein